MNQRRIVGVLVFFVLAGIVLTAAFFGPGLLLSRTSPGSQAVSIVTATTGNVIQRENAQPGTTNWQIPTSKAASTEIQAYTSATSVQPGHSLTFYVSTQEEGTPFSIDVYRLGWYGGDGGRLMVSVANQIGHAQGYYNSNTHLLVGCGSCYVDVNTGLVEADWQPSYTLTIPSDWTTGTYLAKFTDAKGKQTYAPFDILGNSSSTYVAVTPDTTYQAYNAWGGYSLYEADNSLYSGSNINASGKGVKVSFDRPYADDYGSSQVLVFIADAIRWFERQGYDLSYISDVDLHNDPAQLLHHHAYLSLGQDEYWTKEMRDGVESARDRGVGLAFLGASASYWQMRFDPDSAGIKNRTIVCYKVETSRNDLALDPFYGKDNSRVTAQWRDPIVARPENALIGIMFSSFTRQQRGFPWRVNPGVDSPIISGTGLRPGRNYGCGLVGYEWDHIFVNGATPADLQVLGVSNTIATGNQPDFSNTTYYIATSGAMVFATGSIYWTTTLDDYRFSTENLCTNQNLVVPGLQLLMAHVMDALAVLHPSHHL